MSDTPPSPLPLPETLLEEVRALYQQDPTTEDALDRAMSLLDTISRENGESDEIRQWYKRVEKKRREYQARKIYQKTKKECEALWAQEQDRLKEHVSPEKILTEIYGKARTLAAEAAAAYPEYLPLDGLKNDAETRYNRARRRYEIKDTSTQGKAYALAIRELEMLADEDPEQKIPWQDEKGMALPPIAVREAILDLERQAANYAHTKAQEYLKTAKEHLEAHQPSLAEETIRKYEDLYNLPPEDKGLLERYLEEEILPQIQDMRTAETHLRQAGSEGNIIRAWKLFREAVRIYPWAPGIEATRTMLERRSLQAAAELLEEAEGQLESFRRNTKARDIGTIEKRLEEAAALLENLSLRGKDEKAGHHMRKRLTEQLATLQNEVKSAARFLQDVEQKIEALLQQEPESAQRGLDILLETYSQPPYSQYGELKERFPRLHTLQARLHAHQDFENALSQLDEAFHSAERERIQQALQDAQDIRTKAKDAEQRSQTKKHIRQLKGRLHFIDAQEAQAEGDIAKALRFFQKVVAIPSHPDFAAARQAIEKIEAAQENEEKVRQMLEESRTLLGLGEFSRAYQKSSQALDLPSRQRRKIHELRAQIRREWEADLLKRLDSAIQEQSALSPDDIRDLANKLMNLPEPRTPQSIHRAKEVLGLAYARDAETFQRQNRWQEALRAWENALKESPFNAAYETNLHTARLQAAKQQLRHAHGPKEIQGILADLQEILPNNPEVFELQANHAYRFAQDFSLDTHQRLEHLQEARSALRTAMASPNISHAMKGRLEDLQKKVERLEELYMMQRRIEDALTPEASRSQIAEALSQINQLLQEYTADTQVGRHLSLWKKQHIQKLVQALERYSQSLREEQVWEQFDTHSKIAQLMPEHRLARQLVRNIPSQIDQLVIDINSVLADRQGLMINEVNPLRILRIQQERLFALRERADALHEVARLMLEQSGDAERLRNEIVDAITRLQARVQELSALQNKVIRLQDALRMAKQDDDWYDFKQILQEINQDGFGDHRSVRLLLAEREKVTDKRRKLERLSTEIKRTLQDPEGKHILQALPLLDDLEKEDSEDEYGFQTDLSVTVPWTGESIRGITQIRAWLRRCQEQQKRVATWLSQAGLAYLWPDIPDADTRNIVPWEKERKKISQMLDRGQFKDVLDLLDSIEGINETIASPNAAPRGNVLQSYQGYLTLLQAREEIARQPRLEEDLTPPFLRKLVHQTEDVLQRVDEDITSLRRLRATVREKQRQCQIATNELEQALNELRDASTRPRWLRNRTRVEKAHRRVEQAVQNCRQIAPRHPILNNINSQIASYIK